MLEGKKTYIGLTVALLAGIVSHFGVDVTAADQASVAGFVAQAFQVAGLVMAYYGRYKAKK